MRLIGLAVVLTVGLTLGPLCRLPGARHTTPPDLIHTLTFDALGTILYTLDEWEGRA
jgi:hypothetical protein